MRTFFWHDYETFGLSPSADRPAQFAGIRTDENLNEIDEPIELYCQPTPDYVQDVYACMVTGITPLYCLTHGLREYKFAACIEQELSKPNTIGVGYNSIRFDDEVTRFLFWRNLIDPYAREWQNGCGRWDIIDLVRTAYALRPDGIEWPKREDGSASLRLEDLSAANGLEHESAHDALSDVRATIALAKLVREKQPRLFDYCFKMRDKSRVEDEIGLYRSTEYRQPFLHISGMFSAERGCMAMMLPIARHPTKRNEIIAWDLNEDPKILLDLNSEEIKMRMFTAASDLPQDVERLPIKTIHTNRSPVVISNLRTLSHERAQYWNMNIEQSKKFAESLDNAAWKKMDTVWQTVFENKNNPLDVDEDLYSGFVKASDRRQLNRIRSLPPEEWGKREFNFEDTRLEQILFRYRARNFPETLTPELKEQWKTHCEERIKNGINGARTIKQALAEIEKIYADAPENRKKILDELSEYFRALQ